jgi:hypothetical protein
MQKKTDLIFPPFKVVGTYIGAACRRRSHLLRDIGTERNKIAAIDPRFSAIFVHFGHR